MSEAKKERNERLSRFWRGVRKWKKAYEPLIQGAKGKGGNRKKPWHFGSEQLGVPALIVNFLTSLGGSE